MSVKTCIQIEGVTQGRAVILYTPGQTCSLSPLIGSILPFCPARPVLAVLLFPIPQFYPEHSELYTHLDSSGQYAGCSLRPGDVVPPKLRR